MIKKRKLKVNNYQRINLETVTIVSKPIVLEFKLALSEGIMSLWQRKLNYELVVLMRNACLLFTTSSKLREFIKRSSFLILHMTSSNLWHDYMYLFYI